MPHFQRNPLPLASYSPLAVRIRFIDLSQAFSGIEEPLYVDSCCHFSERGNEILAEAIAAALGDSG